jgi:hypothetical protein
MHHQKASPERRNLLFSGGRADKSVIGEIPSVINRDVTERLLSVMVANRSPFGMALRVTIL